MIEFLRACNNPALISFEATCIIEWTLDQVEEFCQVLAGHCASEYLQTLELEFFGTDILPPHPGGFFRPLFSFARLSAARIMVPDGYDLDESTVVGMARA